MDERQQTEDRYRENREERAVDNTHAAQMAENVKHNRTRIDRIERAVFGYKDEGGAIVVGILGSMKDMNDALYGGWDETHKERVPGILEISNQTQKFQGNIAKGVNKVVYALGMVIVIGLFNALHLSGEWVKIIEQLFH